MTIPNNETDNSDKLSQDLLSCVGFDRHIKAPIVETVASKADGEMKQLVLDTIRTHPIYNEGEKFEFTSEYEARREVKKLLSGRVFEMLCEQEHYQYERERRPISSELETEFEMENALAQIITDIARNPEAYHIRLEHHRIPDAVYVRFNRQEQSLEVDALAEAKLGRLDNRGIEQLSDRYGSRETVREIVAKINEEISAGNPSFDFIKTVLRGRKLTTDPNMEMILLLPKDRQAPDVETLKAGPTRGDYAESLEDTRGLITTHGKKEDRVSMETLLVKRLTEERVAINNSDFSTLEVENMTQVLVDRIFEDNDLRSRLVPERSYVGPRTSTERYIQSPREVLRKKIEEMNEEEKAEYSKWLRTYLDIGAGVNLAKERQKNSRTVSISGNNAMHIPSGVGIRAKESEKPEVALKEALEEHLDQWRLVLGLQKGERITPAAIAQLHEMFES